MRTRILYALVIIALLLFVYYSFKCSLRHRTEIQGMKAWLRSCQGIKVEEITKVIMADSRRIVVLRSGKDTADIRRLLNTMKSMEVEDRERSVRGPIGMIAIVRKGRPGAFNFDGDFDPDHAPIVTDSVRSHDIGRVVQDILKRKGRPVKWPSRNVK